MAKHNLVGKRGEEIAAQIMRQKGFRIADMNWKFGHLEMDIIAISNKIIAFVEVKTRTSDYGNKRPEEYVDILKRHRMAAAANVYIKMNHIEQVPRFDIIGIRMNETTLEVLETTHLEDAFQPPTRTIHSNSYNGTATWHHRHHVIDR